MNKILVIQTASIGDVILATSLLEALHGLFPDAAIDILIRDGNHQLFYGHPFVNHVLIWEKQRDKYQHLLKLLFQIRKSRYDLVVNVQRFFSTGLLTAFSGARMTVGFKSNPLSFLFKAKVPHSIIEGRFHEVDRNLGLLGFLGRNPERSPVRLYPGEKEEQKVMALRSKPYITISPASLWFTKQFPVEKWAEFVRSLPDDLTVYFLGSGEDLAYILDIMNRSRNNGVVNLAGKLNLLESAALMRTALMNYVNDSAPLHLCSAVNAPVTAIFCSTLPSFGFGPLSEDSSVVETREDLHCRPCGLHGLNACPEGHFRCANSIKKEQLLARLKK